MKILIVLALASIAYANIKPEFHGNTAYGYHTKYGIPLAKKIRKAEEQIGLQRIVGGSPASLGDFPYQVGLVTSIAGSSDTSACGGSLVAAQRVITAAHCWFDGFIQAWQFTVVLGSLTLFTGGTRITTSLVTMHPDWYPIVSRYDVAIAYLPFPVSFSNIIQPIALPSGSDLNDDFTGVTAVASGYGYTSDYSSVLGQTLNFINVTVITNSECYWYYPTSVDDYIICTSGAGGTNPCGGDSGGPLTVIRNNKPILIGVIAFGSGLGCQSGSPAAYSRVTYFMDFFNLHIN